MIYIINSPVLTDFGTYTYTPCSVEDVRNILYQNEWLSAIGYEATAQLLSELFGMKIPCNRIDIRQGLNDTLVVFKPLKRLEAGKIYSAKEIEDIGYEFGLLKKNKL